MLTYGTIVFDIAEDGTYGKRFLDIAEYELRMYRARRKLITYEQPLCL